MAGPSQGGAGGDSGTAVVVLKLYIAGRSAKSERALRQLETIAAADAEVEYRIEVIDVIERPQLAEDERIVATPLLVKELPPPMRRVIGDLADLDRVLVGLDLYPGTKGQA